MLDTWTQLADDELDFEKEALPVGENAKWTDGEEIQDIVIRRGYLDSLVRDFNQFKELGIQVPLFKGHIEDADNHRGVIKEVLIKPNSKGIESFHVRGRFNDKKARDQGIHNDVSVMCPPKFVDQKKRVYKFPLRHVALTPVPVIPGMDPFTPIILSFNTPSGLQLSRKVTTMNHLDTILAELEIKAEDGLDDEGKLKLISAKFKALKAVAPPELELSFPPLVLNQMQTGRKTVIQGLVKDFIISPAMGTEMEKQYCNSDSISGDLRLSREQIDSAGTEFDRLVGWAEKFAANRPLKKSGREPIQLSREDGKDNSLIETMKKRAEKAKARA